jgi:hypothetical protein
MIPLDYITEWRVHAPWPQLSQVEQDLVFKRAYDALEDEFAALAALLDARLQEGLTPQSKGTMINRQ